MERRTGKAGGAAAKGLQAALLNEIDGREFYRMAARDASSEAVRELFEFLMAEEARHYAALLEQAGRLAAGKPLRFRRDAAGRKKLAAFRGGLVTPRLVADARTAEGEIAALSIGMTLERRAVRQFETLRGKAERAGDEAAAALFAGLADWEREHLDLLLGRYEAVRESFWEAAGFWPF